MNITDFIILDTNGNHFEYDAFGNNIAFNCYECGHPILATASKNQRGWDEEHPVDCKKCGEQYFLDIRDHAEKLYIHNLRMIDF